MQIILLQLLSVLSQHQLNVELIKELTFKNKVILDERKNEVKILLIQFTYTYTFLTASRKVKNLMTHFRKMRLK